MKLIRIGAIAALSLIALLVVVSVIQRYTMSERDQRESACEESLRQVTGAIDENAWGVAEMALPAAKDRCPYRRKEVDALDEKIKANRGGARLAGKPTASGAERGAACSAHDRWFDGHLSGTPEANKTAFISELGGWAPECRKSAFQEECAQRCDDFVSGMLIAAGSTSEKAEMYRWRLATNKESVSTGRAILGKVKQLRAYCRSIIGVPRAVSPECMSRMRDDFDKIGTLDRELVAQLPRLPEGFVALRGTLSFAKGCVNCATDDRWQCAEMDADVKVTEENLAEAEKLVAADEKIVARLK